jgi:prepilin-type N-terminal cleavage/methylation domain-containing protein
MVNKKTHRAGFTLAEITVTVVILGIVAVIVAQVVVWSLQERGRLSSKEAALELADNVLEAARAQSFDKLDQAWADAQVIPVALADLLPEGKLTVKVEPVKQSRRITVEVRWQYEEYLPPHSVALTSILSDRVASKTGGQP